MRIVSFRVRNFRSIVDSRWQPMSPDGITVLVGQNESGKTSVLDALAITMSEQLPTEDDFRIGAPLPSVSLRVDVDRNAISRAVSRCAAGEKDALSAYLDEKRGIVELIATWVPELVEGKKTYLQSHSIGDTTLDHMLDKARQEIELAQAGEAIRKDLIVSPAAASATSAPAQATISSTTAAPPADVESEVEPAYENFDSADLAKLVHEQLPLGVLFNETTGSLPSQVDIDKGKPVGPGAVAALNFLSVAGISLPDLMANDLRGRNNTLNRANDLVSKDFNAFWTQTIGAAGKLSLKCDIGHYDSTVVEKAGKPRLIFWIIDGNTQLYPKQRSQGVRWFISFYLQLKASEKSKSRRLFLLDEPGANLHSKAQGDVLRLINKLGKETSIVVYSTHSPQMLEYDKLFRVLAVQRDGDQDDSPTDIIDAHRLGAASSDTLSPVLSAMGVDLSSHQVIRKENNVLLEEMSGYYYLSRFWKLTSQTKDAHFIAATGVNKIEALANMFMGWGLDFIVAVDDDKQGREAFKSMKRELFGDVEDVAAKRLVKIPCGPAIEDVLSPSDFKKMILGDSALAYTASNAEYVKSNSRSKPV